MPNYQTEGSNLSQKLSRNQIKSHYMLQYLFYNILIFLCFCHNINYRKLTLILFDLNFSKYFIFIVLCNGKQLCNWVSAQKEWIPIKPCWGLFVKQRFKKKINKNKNCFNLSLNFKPHTLKRYSVPWIRIPSQLPSYAQAIVPGCPLNNIFLCSWALLRNCSLGKQRGAWNRGPFKSMLCMFAVFS